MPIERWCEIIQPVYPKVGNGVAISTANAHDITNVHKCLHGSENIIHADSGYTGIADRPEVCEIFKDGSGNMRKVLESKGRGYYKVKNIVYETRRVKFKVSKKRSQVVSRKEKQNEYKKSSTRWKVENPFLIVKHIFKFRKTRLPSLAKNENKLYVMFALTNCLIISQKNFRTKTS